VFTFPALAQKSSGPTEIDSAILAAWQREGITPAAPADDSKFLRRIYLDIIGTIPSPQVVSDFVSDTSKGKRAAAVDALLSDPRYIDHWTTYWDGVLMGKQAFSPVVDRNEFRAWLHSEIANNTPWNQFVTKLITASGQNSTGPTYQEANAPGMISRQAEDNGAAQQPVNRSRINGAVNWQLKYAQTPADLSGSASRVFLGVQIQCAQCHDHKTEKWKQTDFKSFTACFTQAIPIPAGGFAQQMQRMRQGQQQRMPINRVREVDLTDVNYAVRPNQLNGGQERAIYLPVAPAALDGTSFAGAPAARRRNLAAWMTSGSNEWFARAYVNRIWARFLGRGFVEPIDDFRPSNPPIIPEALDALAEQFAVSGYDTKQLIRTICATKAYQLDSGAADKQDAENRYFDRYRLKPVETDALLNSLVAATNFQTVLERMPGGASLDQIKARLQRQLTFVFNTDEEESEQKEFEGTIPQALLLLNGSLTNNGVMPIPGTALAEVMAMEEDGDRIESLYLRSLSRNPTAEERQRWIAFVNAPREVIVTSTAPFQSAQARSGASGVQPGQNNPGGQRGQAGAGPGVGARMAARVAAARQNPKLQAYEDMFWALLNSSEFAFNH
jgi:hypothetical protein